MRILEKISKLLALSKSSNPNEAALAAEKAQALMDEHSITMSQISQAERDAGDPIGHETSAWGGRYAATRHRWKRSIASNIATMNHCRIILDSSTGQMIICGRASNREVAAYFIQYLCKTLERLAEEAWEISHEKAYIENMQARFPWRNYRTAKAEYIASFGAGAADEVIARLKERRKAFEEQQQALVLAEMAPVNSWFSANFRTKPLRSGWQVGGTGVDAGREAGRNIALNDAVRGAVPNHRRIA
jgi:hypothetical protein